MKLFIVLALALAIGLGTAVSPFASASPDGLSKVAEEHSFDGRGRTNSAPVPGYAFPGVHDEKLAKGLAGFTGTLVVFGLAFGVASIARRRPVHT